MSTSPKLRHAIMAGVLSVTALGVNCMRMPPDVYPLFFETNAVLPSPDPNEMLQATYDSSDGRARISVFPGTTLPGPLTIERIDPSQAASPLQNAGNHFALRLGPDGTQFNNPVRLSLLVGEVAVLEGDAFVAPSVEVFTEDAAKVETLVDPVVEVTDDGLVIAHVMTTHFSDYVYRLKIGIDIVIDAPKNSAVYEVGETVMTGMTVQNSGDDFIRVAPIEAINMPPLGNLAYNTNIVELESKAIKPVGMGSCKCNAAGQGNVEYNLFGDHTVDGPIDADKSVVKFKQFRQVNCTLLETQIVVTFDAETHTTNYDVSVFHTTASTNYQRVEITNNVRVKYVWSSISTCGTFGNPRSNPFNSYEHEGCSAQVEAAARVGVTVMYTADDGRVISHTYNQPARANEGSGAIAF